MPRNGASMLITLAVILLVTGSLIGPQAYVGPASARSQNLFDFGDAPDGGPTGYPPGFARTGSFPTLRSSDGARTETTAVRLGPEADREADANVVLDPRGTGDADDGMADMIITLTGIPSTARLAVAATSTGSVRPGTTYYLNVLVDLNMDGRWGGTAAMGEPEWAVRNHRVVVDGPNEDLTITPPAFAYGNGARLPNAAWMRVALTNTPVGDADWDGTGSFADGEIEDHFVSFRVSPDRPPRKTLRTECGQRVYYFNGRAQLPFSCRISNPAGGVDPTDYDWTLGRLDGGVIVTGPPNAGPYRNGPFANPQPAPNAPLMPPPGSGTVVLAPGETIDVPFVAHRGVPLPSRWVWRVTIADPPAAIHDWGVVPGHGGTGQVELEFRELPAASRDTFVLDPSEEDVFALLDAILAHPRADDFVQPDDTVVVDVSEEPLLGYAFVSVKNVGQQGKREVTLYTDETSDVKGDVTIRTTASGVRAVANSQDPVDAFTRGILRRWIVVTFNNPAAQFSWNALFYGSLMRIREGREQLRESTPPLSTAGPIGEVPELPPRLRGYALVPAPDPPEGPGGYWLVHRGYGHRAGWLPERRSAFADPPPETGIDDLPAGVGIPPFDPLFRQFPPPEEQARFVTSWEIVTYDEFDEMDPIVLLGPGVILAPPPPYDEEQLRELLERWGRTGVLAEPLDEERIAELLEQLDLPLTEEQLEVLLDLLADPPTAIIPPLPPPPVEDPGSETEDPEPDTLVVIPGFEPPPPEYEPPEWLLQPPGPEGFFGPRDDPTRDESEESTDEEEEETEEEETEEEEGRKGVGRKAKVGAFIDNAPVSPAARPSYTRGMSYLRESGGGSYAIGMATGAYARQAARTSPSYGATAALAVGGGYFAAGVV